MDSVLMISKAMELHFLLILRYQLTISAVALYSFKMFCFFPMNQLCNVILLAQNFPQNIFLNRRNVKKHFALNVPLSSLLFQSTCFMYYTLQTQMAPKHYSCIPINGSITGNLLLRPQSKFLRLTFKILIFKI